MGEMLSNMVFRKLSGELRTEWTATFAQDSSQVFSGGLSPPLPGPISAPLIRLQASNSMSKFRRLTVEGDSSASNGAPENNYARTDQDSRLFKSLSAGRRGEEEDQGIMLTTHCTATTEEMISIDKQMSSSPGLSLDGNEATRSSAQNQDLLESVGEGAGDRLTSTQIAATTSKSKSTSLNRLGKEQDLDLDVTDTFNKEIIVGGSVRDEAKAEEGALRLTHERGSWLPELPPERRVLLAFRSMPVRRRDSRVSFSPDLQTNQDRPEGSHSTFDPASFLLSTTQSTVPSSSHNASVDRTSRVSAPGSTPNAPGSGLSSTKLVKLNPAINRVLKTNKLVEPYVNRNDRKSTADSTSAQQSHMPEVMRTLPNAISLLEIEQAEEANGDTSLMEAEAEEESSNSRSTSLSLVAAKELINAAISYSPLPKDLAFWPELIKMGLEFHSSPQKSLFFSEFQGQSTLLKVLRRPATTFDSRPCISPRHLKLLQQLSEISHPNLVRLLMVFPAVFEITQGERSLKDDPRTQITGIQPRRGKYRRCCALLTENFERSMSLADAISSGTLLTQGGVAPLSSKSRSSRLRKVPHSLFVPVGSQSSGARMSHPTTLSSSEDQEGGGVNDDGGDVFDEGHVTPLRAHGSAQVGGCIPSRSSSARAHPSTSTSVNRSSLQLPFRGGLLRGGPNLPLIRVILIQVATGLRALHQSGLLHGQVTPENVLLLRPSTSPTGNIFRAANNGANGRQMAEGSSSALSLPIPLPPHPRSQAQASKMKRPGSTASAAFETISEDCASRGPSKLPGMSGGFGGILSSASPPSRAEHSSHDSPGGSSITLGPRTQKSVGFSSGSFANLTLPSQLPAQAISSSTVNGGKLEDGNGSNNQRSYTLALMKQPKSHSTSKGEGSMDPNVLLSSYTSDGSDLGLLATDGSSRVAPSNAPKVPKSSDPFARPLSTESVELDAGNSLLPNESARYSNNFQGFQGGGACLSNSFFTNNSLSGRSLQVQVKLKDAAFCTISLDPPRSNGSTLLLPVMVQKLACRPCPSSLTPYLPPEVLEERQRPKRSADIFALGVLMWEVFNGKRVKDREEANERGELEWTTEVPAPYRALAEKCMSKDLAERPSLKSILRSLVQMTD